MDEIAIHVNAQGGKQSDEPYRFTDFDAKVMLRIGARSHKGYVKYGPKNYLKIPIDDHVNHALLHIHRWQAYGQEIDGDELAGAVCRLLFAMEIEGGEGMTKHRSIRQQQKKMYLQRQVDKLRDQLKNLRVKQRGKPDRDSTRPQKQPTVAAMVANDFLALRDCSSPGTGHTQQAVHAARVARRDWPKVLLAILAPVVAALILYLTH